MAAEAVYHPSATEKTTPSATAPKKQPNTPAAPPASQSAPPKPETAPQDPIAALDKQAAGDNLVTVRFFGHPLGQAYMFTNPGAPVISLESFTSLLERPMTWELVGPKQLRLSAGKETFLTRDFVVLNNRIWLILRPELAGQLGLKVVSYGNQVLDLELKP